MPAIDVVALKKRYGALAAVDEISFSVEAGEIFSLLGPNGAGKTTTVEILEGLRQRDSGEVSVLGMDPWKQGYQLHFKIGVIPQGFRFFDKSTPGEAITYYADLFGVKVDPDQILRTQAGYPVGTLDKLEAGYAFIEARNQGQGNQEPGETSQVSPDLDQFLLARWNE